MKRLVSLAVIDSDLHSSPVQGASKKKNPLTYFSGVFKKYAVFTGRARRAEVWYFALFNFIITIAALIALGISASTGNGNPGAVFIIVMAGYPVYFYMLCIPSLALFVRRIHDAGKSGWFALVPVYNIILLFIPGTSGPNRFGPDPKQAEPEAPGKVPSGMMALRILSIFAPIWYIGCFAAAMTVDSVVNKGRDIFDKSNETGWIIGSLLILVFALIHAITTFLQGGKYQSKPVKILAIIDFVLLGLGVFVWMIHGFFISPKLQLIVSEFQTNSAEYLKLSKISTALLIGVGVGVALLYSIITAVITVIWSFKEKKTE
jgi:uncharacterized membrane protein YhaH (DUF805 family)